MAGNTGKMTKDAIAKRGPRKVLVKFYDGRGDFGFSIYTEGQEPTGSRVIARSYSESYLNRIAKVYELTS